MVVCVHGEDMVVDAFKDCRGQARPSHIPNQSRSHTPPPLSFSPTSPVLLFSHSTMDQQD